MGLINNQDATPNFSLAGLKKFLGGIELDRHPAALGNDPRGPVDGRIVEIVGSLKHHRSNFLHPV